MSKVTLKEIEYKNFGKCIEISNQIVKLIATVDVGPRIINYSFVDGENIMWEDVDRVMVNEDVTEAYGSPWYIYGGHRLWTSPEKDPRSYYADNHPVEWEEIPNGARFVQEIQTQNQCQCEISVTLSPDSTDVSVSHKITNTGAWDTTFAVWALSVLSQGGIEIVPQPTVDNGLLHNRTLGLWSYSRMTDPRVAWGDRYITLRQDTTLSEKFKLGLNSEHGYAIYFNHGDAFVKKFNLVENGTYPDGGMSFETFTNNLFLEMESLGELKTVAPGESISHSEYWSLKKADAPKVFDEEEFDRITKELLG